MRTLVLICSLAIPREDCDAQRATDTFYLAQPCGITAFAQLAATGFAEPGYYAVVRCGRR